MIAIQSASTIAFCALALHVTTTSQFHVIAEYSSSVAIDSWDTIRHNSGRKRLRRRLSCSSSLGWHVDTDAEDGCTNNDKYPPQWAREDMKRNFFFESAEQCCSKFFKDDCQVYDRCQGGGVGVTPPAPVPTHAAFSTPSSTCLWHADIESRDGCTNDSNHPKQWLQPGIREKMFFFSSDSCCDKFFAQQDSECKVYDRGCQQAPTPRPSTESPTPQPTVSIMPTGLLAVFYSDSYFARGICVSSIERPLPHYVTQSYSNYDQCCRQASPDVNLCLEVRPSSLNGQPLGTFAPTVTPPDPIYYSEHDTGLCVDELKKPRPWHATSAFADYNRCCIIASIDTEKCLANKPAEQPVVQAKEDVSNTMYYISDRVCTKSSDQSKPDGIVETFNNLADCCRNRMLDETECLSGTSALVEEEEEEEDTTEERPEPVYYAKYNSYVCVDEYEEPRPYYTTDTYSTFEQCCKKASTDEDLCLGTRPTLTPTMFPTLAPSTPWPTETKICPDAYDSTTTFEAGSEVHVNNVIFRCRPEPFAFYCNHFEFQPTDRPERNNNKRQGPNWQYAWERLSSNCISFPSISPTMHPTTPSPTPAPCNYRWHPKGIGRRNICTNSLDFPSSWSLIEAYFTDTAEQCCKKFYRNEECKVKDVC